MPDLFKPLFRRKAFRAAIPLMERRDLEDALAGWRADHVAITRRIAAVEAEINDRVVRAFGLSPEDARLLEEHARQAMIDYPLGSA
jgi:hypothetical protein